MKRCGWVGTNPVMMDYHDREWGVPVHDDRKHFEFLVLEAAQAGLSWSIVLNKREGYRRAFSDFDPGKVAVSEGSGRIRKLRRVLLEIRRWTPEGQPLEDDAADSRNVIRVRCLQQRPQTPRIQFRRFHRYICAYAGRRNGERPSGGLLPVSPLHMHDDATLVLHRHVTFSCTNMHTPPFKRAAADAIPSIF